LCAWRGRCYVQLTLLLAERRQLNRKVVRQMRRTATAALLVWGIHAGPLAAQRWSLEVGAGVGVTDEGFGPVGHATVSRSIRARWSIGLELAYVSGVAVDTGASCGIVGCFSIAGRVSGGAVQGRFPMIAYEFASRPALRVRLAPYAGRWLRCETSDGRGCGRQRAVDIGIVGGLAVGTGLLDRRLAIELRYTRSLSGAVGVGGGVASVTWVRPSTVAVLVSVGSRR
jgi:hypothetical protein